jgi:AAA+ ATPase superfamily predicted ATPase
MSALMNRIFKNNKEPLFGRADYQITVPPFTLGTSAEILQDHGLDVDRALSDYMVLTGGVPKYLEIVVDIAKKEFPDFLDEVLFMDSLLINEGKIALIEEFSKNYSVYFTILQLIASGKTKRSEILDSLPGVKEIGGYLSNLMEDYEIIKKIAPIGAPVKSKNIRYQLDDYFYAFWFRFIYKNQSAIEAGNFRYIKEKILQEWPIHKGIQFENLIRNQLKELSVYNVIGSYWDRKGENEIDIVAVNDLDKALLIGECKLNKDKINFPVLKKKTESFINNHQKYKEYKIDYRGFYPGMLKEIM